MNFFSNKLKPKKYKKIAINYNKKISKEFVLKNWGLFSGDKSFYRTLKLFQLISQIQKIKGDVVEFGIWNGNNLLTIKKILDFLKSNKKLYGYDHFKGLKNPHRKDKYFSKSDIGSYAGDKKLINYLIKFFRLKNIEIIEADIMNLEKKLINFKKISFIYIDCDLYEPTLKILKLLAPKISKGGIVAFDQGNNIRNLPWHGKTWTGETEALNEFLLLNKKKFKKTLFRKGYNPEVILTKLF